MATRDQILDAALNLFTEKGFSQTSASAIQKLAGVSNGSFFHAFSSKTELGAALYLRSLTSYQQAIAESLAPDMAAGEGVAAMVQAHVSWVVNEKQQAQFLFGQSQSNWIETIRSQQREANEALQKVISAWAVPLIENNTLIQLSPVVMAAQLLGPVQVICRTWLSGREENDPGENIDELIAVTQRALLINP